MSAVEFGGVEIATKVGTTIIGNAVVTPLRPFQKSVVTEFREPVVYTRAVAVKIVSNNGRSKRKIAVIEEFEDLIVYPHLHPLSSITPHTQHVTRLAFISSGDRGGINPSIVYFLLIRGNTYNDASITGLITTVGVAPEAQRESLRAGAKNTDPMVVLRPCEQTPRCLINQAPTRPKMERKDAAPRAGRPSGESRRARRESTSTPIADTQSEATMCDAAGCSKTTPGGGFCRQCQTERKWEQGQEHTLDGEYLPDCRNCNEPVDEKHYLPDKPGVVVCEDCMMEINATRDLTADGGELLLPLTTVELETSRGLITIDVDRNEMATEPATVDQARKCAGVDADEFNGGRIQ